MLKMKKIVMSAYTIDPYGVSEAFTAFNYLIFLKKKYRVILITDIVNKNNLEHFFSNETPNLTIYYINDSSKLFRKNVFLYNSFKLGYFIFNYRQGKLIKKHKEVFSNVHIAFFKSPSSYRYTSSLSKLNAKYFIVGPAGGGIQYPKGFKKYRKKEKWYYKLRNYDRLIFKLPYYKRYARKVDLYLVNFPYAYELISPLLSNKAISLSETGLDTYSFNGTNKICGKFKMLYVGRLIPYKGVELIIKALGLIQRDLSKHKWSLDIIGEGIEKRSLIKLVQELNLSDHVFFKGKVSKAKVFHFYKTSNLLLFPSLKESGGNVYLEAMANGLPIIAINHGSPKYILPDKGTVKIDPLNENFVIYKIGEAILKYINSEEKLITDSKLCVDFVRKTFDWKIIEKEFNKILENYE